MVTVTRTLRRAAADRAATMPGADISSFSTATVVRAEPISATRAACDPGLHTTADPAPGVIGVPV